MASTAPTAPPSRLERRRMSYDDYLALPESVRAEWVDGEVVMSPPPTYRHQKASKRLTNLLEAALPDLCVIEAVTVMLPHSRERIPDVIVLAAEPEGEHITEVPLLLVEVLSPSTRSEDMVRTSAEYLTAGVGQYWLLDVHDRVLDVFTAGSGEWEPMAHFDEQTRRGSVELAPYGGVDLDLTALLA